MPLFDLLAAVGRSAGASGEAASAAASSAVTADRPVGGLRSGAVRRCADTDTSAGGDGGSGATLSVPNLPSALDYPPYSSDSDSDNYAQYKNQQARWAQSMRDYWKQALDYENTKEQQMTVDKLSDENKALMAIAREVLVELTNNERSAHGLQPLVEDPLLSLVAERRSIDMMNRGYFAHEIPLVTGLPYTNHVDREIILLSKYYGYNSHFQNISENLARNDWLKIEPMGEAMADTHIDLMESPPHRAAILDPRWKYTGMGVVFDDNGDLVLTQLFGN